MNKDESWKVMEEQEMGDISVKLRKEFTRQVWTMFEGGSEDKKMLRMER